MAALGRWGQVDPLADQYAGHSPYNYVLGNPNSFVDPDGRAALCVFAAPVCAVAVAAARYVGQRLLAVVGTGLASYGAREYFTPNSDNNAANAMLDAGSVLMPFTRGGSIYSRVAGAVGEEVAVGATQAVLIEGESIGDYVSDGAGLDAALGVAGLPSARLVRDGMISGSRRVTQASTPSIRRRAMAEGRASAQGRAFLQIAEGGYDIFGIGLEAELNARDYVSLPGSSPGLDRPLPTSTSGQDNEQR